MKAIFNNITIIPTIGIYFIICFILGISRDYESRLELGESVEDLEVYQYDAYILDTFVKPFLRGLGLFLWVKLLLYIYLRYV
jgi:transcriptional regulator with XRE-family HTH domain